MGLKMKNVNIMGVYQFLGEGVMPTFNFNLSKIEYKTWSENWTYPFLNTYE